MAITNSHPLYLPPSLSLCWCICVPSSIIRFSFYCYSQMKNEHFSFTDIIIWIDLCCYCYVVMKLLWPMAHLKGSFPGKVHSFTFRKINMKYLVRAWFNKATLQLRVQKILTLKQFFHS